MRGHSFLCGVLEALLLPLAFCALGLAWWGTALRAEGVPPTYPRAWMEATAMTQVEPAPTPSEWLVDGFNVVQVGMLGGQDRSQWWGVSHRARLLSHAAAFEPGQATVWIVFDGGHPRPESEVDGRTRVVFTPSADEWLVARVRGAEDPSRLVVVTADRRLAARVRHLGARIASPAEFLARCTRSEEWGDFAST